MEVGMEVDPVAEGLEDGYVKRRRGASVVMMSEADVTSLLETAYLLRSPRNARRLFGALGRALKGDSGVRMTVEDIEKFRDEVSGDREKA
jgi:antitoxin YefM